MDMLFSKYASPFEFMRPYIETGRFGEWVNEIITAENKRRKEQAEKEEDEKLWLAYVHIGPDKSFSDWKAELLQQPSPNVSGKRDEDMTDADVDALLSRLFTTE